MSTTLSIAPDTLLIAPTGLLQDEFNTAGTPPVLTLSDPPGEHDALLAVGDLLRIVAPAFQDPASATVAVQYIHKFWLPGGFPMATTCDVWLKVLSVSDEGTHFAYTVDQLHGPACRFPAGTPVARYGQIDDQRILLTSTLDGAPYMDVFDVGAAPWTGAPPRVRLGRLDDLPQVDAPTYGLAAGGPLDADAQRYTVVDQGGVRLQGSSDETAALAAAQGDRQTVQLDSSGRLRMGADLAAEATTALDLDPASGQLTLRTALQLEDALRSQGAIALTNAGKVTLLATPDGALKLGADTSLPEQTGFFYDVSQGALTIRGTTALEGDTTLAGDFTVQNEGVATARLGPDGSLLLGADVTQPDGVHFSSGADGSLAVGAGREGGAALAYAPDEDRVTVRSALTAATLDTGSITATDVVTVSTATGQAATTGASIGGDGRVRFGRDLAAAEGAAFDLDSAAKTLNVQAETQLRGGVGVEGDLRLGQDGVTRIFLGQNGDVRFGTDADSPDGSGFFYTSSSRKLILTAPLDAREINATAVETGRLTSEQLTAEQLSAVQATLQQAAVEADASVAGRLAVGDDGLFVVGSNENIKIDNRGVTMRMLPGEDGSVRVLGIGRAALLNAYQTSDSVQTFDMLAYYNSGIPKLHGSINLGVADVSGKPADLYLRLTRYHTGARNLEVQASFVDMQSERIQLRGAVNVRGNLEFTGGGGRVFRLLNLPTSAAGLPSGAVWNDDGALRIIP